MTNLTKTTSYLAAFLLGSAALAVTPVQSVDVEVNLDAIENAKAANYWTDIADDLQAEIIARLAPQVGKEGASVSIDIDEVSLANTFESTLGWADNYLVGDVLISNLNDNSDHQFYTLKVSFEQAKAYLPTATNLDELTSDSPYYYESMVDAFAENVVSKLQ